MSFDNIMRSILRDNDVSATISHIKSALTELNLGGDFAARVGSIEADYDLMCGYLCRGFRDEQLDNVYDDLLRRLLTLSIDMRVCHKTRSLPSYISARLAASDTSTAPEDVRTALESYVQDIAMSALDGQATGTGSTSAINERHFQYMRKLFGAILASGAWTDSMRSGYTALLSSPTIDPADAMLTVSAVSLSVSNVFDPQKWCMLADVYHAATDEGIRQRALTGWAIAMPGNAVARLYPDVNAATASMLADEGTRKQLLELQTQMIYCCNADNDNKEIQRDIMPTLMKNNGLKASRLGIEEQDDRSIDDILGNEDADKKMEQVEKSIKRMMDMQKAGADIYFGGFSQMKRFAFFNELCNWFYPFSASHPMLSQAAEKLSGSRFITTLEKNGPFCSSDKYSFVLALAQIVHQLPANVREMLGSDTMFGTAISESERATATHIRLDYVQSVFRFHRLHNNRSDFANPFSLDTGTRSHALFFTRRLMADGRLTDCAASLARFLLKRKHVAQAISVLGNFMTDGYGPLTYLMAVARLQAGDAQAASALIDIIPQADRNEDVMRSEGHCAMSLKHFDRAAAVYGRLLGMRPDSLSYALSLAISQISGSMVDDGVKLLFKLNYEHPDNANVSRALAWGLMLKGNFSQADGIYSQIAGGDKSVPADMLNGGYAKWLSHDMAGAVALLRRYCGMLRADGKDATKLLADDFSNDAALLDSNGVKRSERKIMLHLATADSPLP